MTRRLVFDRSCDHGQQLTAGVEIAASPRPDRPAGSAAPRGGQHRTPATAAARGQRQPIPGTGPLPAPARRVLGGSPGRLHPDVAGEERQVRSAQAPFNRVPRGESPLPTTLRCSPRPCPGQGCRSSGRLCSRLDVSCRLARWRRLASQYSRKMGFRRSRRALPWSPSQFSVPVR